MPLSPPVDLEFNVPEILETGVENSESLLTTVLPLTSEVVGELILFNTRL